MQVSDTELCCICFDQVCTIEVQDCGHQMCAQCTLALCCHNKPNPKTASLNAPLCPFCRSNIAQLVVANVKTDNEMDSKLRRSKKSRNFCEGSSSFKGLSAMGSFSKLGGRGSGRIAAENECVDDKASLFKSFIATAFSTDHLYSPSLSVGPLWGILLFKEPKLLHIKISNFLTVPFSLKF